MTTLLHTDATVDRAVATLERELDRWHAPGVQLVVVRDGAVAYAGGVGVRGVDDPVPVTSATLFHHGSCGKAYTALLAAVLAEDGELDLDAPVRSYVPELTTPDAVIAERVTTRDLLSHRSGLARNDLLWILRPSLSREDILRRIAHLPLAADLRAEMVYSNLGYALAGLVIERATGTAYDEALATRLLAPLGMDATRTSLEAMTATADRARAHLLVDGCAVETPYRSLGGVAPAGQILTTADDAARWLLLHIGAGCVDGEQAIAATTVAATHQLHVAMPAGLSPLPEMALHGYALGWVHSAYRNRPALWHTGGVDGFFTYTLLLPQDGVAALASVNLHMSEIARAAVHDVVDAMLGVENTGWYDRLRADDEVEAPPSPVAAGAPAPASRPASAYAGTYTDPGYGELVVRADGDDLMVRLGETDLGTRHRHYDTWELRYAPLDLDLALTFGADDTGEMCEAVVLLEPATGPTRFRRLRPDSDVPPETP